MQRTCLALGLALAIYAQGAAANAQQRGGRFLGGGPGGDLLSLAVQAPVQSELGLSAEQTGQLDQLRQKRRGALAELRDLSPEERSQRFEKQAQETDAALANVLSPQQLARLRQISLQVRGGSALADPKVAEALSLNDEQKKQVESIRQEAGNRLRSLGQEGDREALRARFAEIRKETGEKMLALLTESQQAKWSELVGKPFEGQLEAFGGRRARPGNE